MQDILIELSDYDVNCQIKNGFFVVGVRFNKSWQVLEPVNPQIEFASQDGMWYYGASLKDVTFDEVFCCIKETIEHNKDLERRLILFQEKVEELKQLFKDEECDKLKTLEFTFKDKEDVSKNEKKPNRNKNKSKEKTKKKQIVDTQITEKVEDKVETVNVTDGIVFVDTIAELSDNKVNQNNYLDGTE